MEGHIGIILYCQIQQHFIFNCQCTDISLTVNTIMQIGDIIATCLECYYTGNLQI